MSENVVVSEDESLIDAIFGDAPEADHHSQEEAKQQIESSDPAPAPEVKDDADEFDPYGEKEDSPFFPDSAEEEVTPAEGKAPETAPSKEDSAEKEVGKAPEKNDVDYQQEISKLNKRLHDTQKAFHETSQKAANLQKRLDELESKKNHPEDQDDDNWFKESDNKEVDAIKQELSEIKRESEDLSAQQQEIQQQANLTAWHQAAAPVRAEHADFDELVYEKLEPMLDEETGDARVRALYLQQKDKSPAGAYNFARNLPLILEMLDNPEGFSAKVASLKKEVNPSSPEDKSPRKVTGNEALRVMNSADFAEEKTKGNRSLIDEIFGEQ
jgi:hypothetical protein